jgi:predicted ATPase
MPTVTLVAKDVFPRSDHGDDEFLTIDNWDAPVQYFVGRNGSGKSRTARAVQQKITGRFLATDRLVGLMNFDNYGWGYVPSAFKGAPIDQSTRARIREVSQESGGALEELYTLKEQPEVWLRVAAFLRRALGRNVELRETAGFLDPYVRLGDVEYSLLRDEGHGLKELVVLLAATYRKEAALLVVDEPELHLHPSLVRLWLTELNRECVATGRRAIVVTHEPSLVRPQSRVDLEALWLFAGGKRPTRVADHVLPVQADRVSASLGENPQVVSHLVFSPRPVLVEGVHDVAALSVALSRSQPPEVIAQTDLVECGGSGAVGLWLEIGRSLGLDVKAIADLDACFAQEVQRVMDAIPQVQEAYREQFSIEPPRTSSVLRPLIQEADKAGVDTDPKSRAKWLANSVAPHTGHASRLSKLLDIWRDAGLWLHAQGTLEDVLSIPSKGVVQARAAASQPGGIDAVADWCAYELDMSGDVELLLNLAVERVAHGIMEAERSSPGASFRAPAGGQGAANERLMSVEPVGEGRHRITIKAPVEFVGYWLEFSRDTPASQLQLQPPGSSRATK